MPKRCPRTVLLALIGLLLVSGVPRPAAALEGGVDASRGALMAVDVFPVRFGGAFRTLVGGAFLVPATLLSLVPFAFTRDPAIFRENAELFVLDPFDYTFRRPLGEDF